MKLTIVMDVPESMLPAKVLVASALAELAGPVLNGALEGETTSFEMSTGVKVAIGVQDEPDSVLKRCGATTIKP